MDGIASGDDRPGLTPNSDMRLLLQEAKAQALKQGDDVQLLNLALDLLDRADRLQSEVTQARQALQQLTEERDQLLKRLERWEPRVYLDQGGTR